MLAAVTLTLTGCGVSGPKHPDLGKFQGPFGTILLERSGIGPSDLGTFAVHHTESVAIAVTCAGTGLVKVSVKPLNAYGDVFCVTKKDAIDTPGGGQVGTITLEQTPGTGDVKVTATKGTYWRFWIYVPAPACPITSTCMGIPVEEPS